MKLLFILPRMIAGGVERVTLSLIEGLQQEGAECTLALRRAYGEFLPEAQKLCPVHEIAAQGMQQFVPQLARLIKREKPTHIITAFADVGLLSHMAMRLSGHKAKWIHAVHNTHARVSTSSSLKGSVRFWLDQRLAAYCYKQADVVVSVSDGIRQDILQRFKCKPNKITTIYNPVLKEEHLKPRARSEANNGSPPRIVALGRLTRQKGFDLLIEAMQQVPQPWTLEIWGEGEDRAALQAQIQAAGLGDFIQLKGLTLEPFSVLRQADLFVLSSRFEGLPTVLIEALASQCQIVAFDCPHGPREILQAGEIGTLVEAGNINALARGISRCLEGISHTDPNALNERVQDFLHKTSIKKWQNIFKIT